jgi:hypothetical protein
MQLKGKYAGISLYDGSSDNLIREAHSHEIQLQSEKVDGTRFLDEYQTEVPIFATWGGSVEAYFDPDDTHFLQLEECARTAQLVTDVVSDGAELRLWLTDSYYYGGDASVDMTISSSKDSLITASLTINGAGALNRTTTGTMPTA